MLPNSDVEADVALSRCVPSGPRSLTPVVRQTAPRTIGCMLKWTLASTGVHSDVTARPIVLRVEFGRGPGGWRLSMTGKADASRPRQKAPRSGTHLHVRPAPLGQHGKPCRPHHRVGSHWEPVLESTPNDYRSGDPSTPLQADSSWASSTEALAPISGWYRHLAPLSRRIRGPLRIRSIGATWLESATKVGGPRVCRRAHHRERTSGRAATARTVRLGTRRA